MNQKTLIGLAVAALIAIVVAIVLNQRSQPRSEGGTQTTYLAPELREHVNDVSKLVVTGAENKVVATLERGENGWTLAEKGGYAVDTGKLRELLLKLADTTLVEQKTANKDKYAVLGVEDVDAKDAKGLKIELGGLAQPLALIVGTANARGDGSFVRRAGEAQSWLASTALNPPKTAADWLKKDLADVPATRIESVAITHPDGKSFKVAKAAEGDANFKLLEVPKGREAGSEFTANGLASTLAGLRFDDVVPAKDAAPEANATKARYAAFDGLVVDATAWEKDGKHYAQFKASLDAAQADKGIAAAQTRAKEDFDTAAAAAEAAKASKDPQPEGAKDAPIKPLAVSDPAKDREQRLAAANKEVADLNAHFDGWTYQLPAHKYANIDKSIDDLLKPVEEKKPAAAPAKKK
ncbi:DUF4340 domain-containing protein [Dokdonella sp.]|uniref:DUF4340 domain-containing protein n=1 Tax=Dokdonella sp. TaxID=2291710 RepID=UPI001B09340C|nr:DUF4340 domain-containing protein [Dokdonella sp.]MBO9662648.1 DUF4340 domain-containing protein [Dokdonella sp.]